MNYSMQNQNYHLKFNLKAGTWDLHGFHSERPALENIEMNFRYIVGGRRFSSIHEKLPFTVKSSGEIHSIHGSQHETVIGCGPDRNGVLYTLTFQLPEKHPFLFWQVNLQNHGKNPVFIDRLEMMNAGFIYYQMTRQRGDTGSHTLGGRVPPAPTGAIKLAQYPGELAFFSNGWQSWSYTGVFGAGDRYHRTRLGPFRSPMMVNPGTSLPKRRGLIASDMFGVLGDRKYRHGILAGFLSQEQHFGSLEALIDHYGPALRMWANGDEARLDPGKSITTDIACVQFLHLDQPDPLGHYVEAVARQNRVKNEWTIDDIPTGWCTWYQYYQNVSADDVRQNLAFAQNQQDNLALDIIQIDDGYEAQVGDWFSFSEQFPQGVAPLAADIRASGLQPGIWLAPFIVHPKSRLIADHPQWILRNRWRRRVNAGFVWNSFNTALDLTCPGALEYVCTVIDKAVHEWGFDYLKLDFLYAAALPGRYQDPTQTRAQVLRTGLNAMREAAGENSYLLGCGCPLGPGIGLLDAMRIGTDVEGRWDPSYEGFQAFFRSEPDMPSARNAIQNALTRTAFHRRWWINDPDCLLARPESQLTPAEVQTLATVIALTGGSLFLSDDLNALPPDRLRLAESMTPLIGKRPHVLDWFDNPTPTRLQVDLEGSAGKWQLLGLFNWADRGQDLEIDLNSFYLNPKLDYCACSFWDGRLYRLNSDTRHRTDEAEPGGNRLVITSMPPHGSAALAVRPIYSHMPAYIGSNLHISQGLEVSSWFWDKSQQLELHLERPGQSIGYIYLYLPKKPELVSVNGAEADYIQVVDNIYKIQVEFVRSAGITLRLSP
jgi:alpha-galactosidase